jgi:ketosteroid isomerase-like protein
VGVAAIGSPTVSERDLTSDEEAVLATNHAFYDAFEARDMDAMSNVWEHSDGVACTHPGWTTLHGWGAVAASWFALFGNGQRLQFIVTGERVRVLGDAGWVACDENILDAGAGGTASALNVFTRSDGQWHVVAHHAGVIAGT